MKNIQIPFELFLDLMNYFWGEDAPEGAEHIKNALQDKMDKIVEREIFTRYKRAVSDQDREMYRQLYLDRKAIPDEARTDEEIKYIEM